MNTTLFKVLYFIPLMVLKLLSITVHWYYNSFMDNPAILQSDLSRLVFIYVIPGIVFLILFSLLRACEWTGLKILLTTPIIFAFFPLLFVCFLFWLPGYIAEKPKRKIENMLDKLSFTVTLSPEQKTGTYKLDKGIKRGIIGEKILIYALKLTPGYKKILSSLYIPVGGDNFTEIDSVLVNKHGIFVWEAKNYITKYYYGKLGSDFWYKYHS